MTDPITGLFSGLFGSGGEASPPPQADPVAARWFPDWNLKPLSPSQTGDWEPGSEDFWKRLNGRAEKAAADPAAPPAPAYHDVSTARTPGFEPRESPQPDEMNSSASYPTAKPATTVEGEFKRVTAPKVSTAGTWTSSDPRWTALNAHQKAAAMALMEADSNGNRRYVNAAPAAPGTVNAVLNAPRQFNSAGYGDRTEGMIVVNGRAYEFINGGKGRGSIPDGAYTVGRFTSGSQRASEGYSFTRDAFELSNVKDNSPAASKQADRDGLLIHSAAGNVTAGCIGIKGDFGQFTADLNAEIAKNNGNPIKLNLGAPSGNNAVHLPTDAHNVLASIHNRASKYGVDVGEHVGTRLYQPTFETSQQARFDKVLAHPDFQRLTEWSQRYAAGQELDPTNGATHFLAKESTMLALEAKNPDKYKSWRKWTGFDENQGAYKGVIIRDGSHAFLAPEGRYSRGRK